MVMMPSAPRNLTAVAGDARVNLTWSSPIYNGVDIIDYYVVYQDEVIIHRVTGLSVNATGLTNGQAYTFIVAAHNSAGIGEQSYSVSATPYPIVTTPNAPTGLTAIAGNTQVSLNWSPPTDDGGASIDYYIVYQDGVDVKHVTGISTTITGLNNGQNYSYTITAHNIVGEGNNSSAILVTPYTVPNGPTGLTAVAGNDQVALNWTAPVFNGGTTIDYYIIYQDSVDVDHTVGLTSTITGLTSGQTYSFAIAAHNLAGNSTQTGLVYSRPFTLPDAPTGLTVVAGNSQMTLNWTAPTFDGGCNITGYKVYRGTSSGSLALIATVIGTTYTDGDVTNGQGYIYQVSAVNSAGESVLTGEVVVTPEAPASNGGSDTVVIIAIGAIIALFIAAIVAVSLLRRRGKGSQ